MELLIDNTELWWQKSDENFKSFIRQSGFGPPPGGSLFGSQDLPCNRELLFLHFVFNYVLHEILRNPVTRSDLPSSGAASWMAVLTAES